MFGLAGQSYRVGQRPGAVTNPTQLPTLQVWYNADIDGSPNFNKTNGNGGTVGQWLDRSAFGHNLNPQGGKNQNAPRWYANRLGVGNTLGIVSFTGSNNESLSINPVSWLQSLSGFSLFIVAKASAVGISSRTMTSTDVGGFRISHNTSNWTIQAAGCLGVSTVTGVADTSKYNIYSLIFDGSGIGNTSRLKFRYNKVPQVLTYTGTANTITSASANTFYVGVGSAGNTEYFTGDIAEIIMFTRAVNSSEIGGIEQYMTSHWNL